MSSKIKEPCGSNPGKGDEDREAKFLSFCLVYLLF